MDITTAHPWEMSYGALNSRVSLRIISLLNPASRVSLCVQL